MTYLAGLTAALTVVACWFFATPAAASGNDVVMVGDSILGLISDELGPQLQAKGWTPHIVATNGSGLTDATIQATGRDWVHKLTAMDDLWNPHTVVVVLGTNDAEAVAAGENYAPHIKELLVTTKARVLWADCSTHTAILERNQGCALVNADLHDATTVVPYDEEVVTSPYFGTTDSVHPNDMGQRLLADELTAWVGNPK